MKMVTCKKIKRDNGRKQNKKKILKNEMRD